MKIEGFFLAGMWIPYKTWEFNKQAGEFVVTIDWPRHFREIAARKGVEVAE
ncbi:MAG: hypothetical protein WC277_04810 [Bacilli bacterium]|jgi:hypothetical protein